MILSINKGGTDDVDTCFDANAGDFDGRMRG